MVELALILPILVMLLLGITEFGRAYSAQISLQSAAREGVRALAHGETAAAGQSAVRSAVGTARVDAVTQTPCPSGTTSTSTSYATVTVTAQFTFSIPFVDVGTRSLSATARMRCGL